MGIEETPALRLGAAEIARNLDVAARRALSPGAAWLRVLLRTVEAEDVNPEQRLDAIDLAVGELQRLWPLEGS